MNTGQTLQQGKMEIISPFLWLRCPNSGRSTVGRHFTQQ
jgi:hypothetical protein